MTGLALILVATSLLMLVVGNALGEARRTRRATLIGAIVVTLFAWLMWRVQHMPPEEAIVMTAWAASICISGFVGLLAGFLLGYLRQGRAPQ